MILHRKRLQYIVLAFLLQFAITNYSVCQESNEDLSKNGSFSSSMKHDSSGQYKQALECFSKISENPKDKDYLRACFMVAEYYFHSRKEVSQDKIKADKYYSIILRYPFSDIEKVNPDILYMLALSNRYARLNNDEAFILLEKAAKAGHIPSQAELAFCYLKGYGVNADVEKTREWAEKASLKGNMFARAILGAYYLNVKKDEAKGISLLEESANAGCSAGQYMLSHCYEKGKGVEMDKKKATDLLQKATDQGLDDAVIRQQLKARLEKGNPK